VPPDDPGPDFRILYERLFEHSVDGVLLTRPDGTVLRANPAACRLLGRPEAEIRHRGRQGLLVDDPAARAVLARRRETGSASGTVRFLRPDGSTFPAEITSTLIPMEGGGPFACSIFRDVTELERAEAALRDGESLLRTLIEAMPDPIFLKDRESRLRLVNDATLKVFGKGAGEVLGRSDREIYADPRVGEALMENDRRIMESGASRVIEEVVPSPDGPRTYLVTKAPVRDADGRVVGVIGHAQDLTDRRQSEEMRALELAIEQLPIGVVLVEVPESGPPRLLAHNAAYDQIVQAPTPSGTSFTEVRHGVYFPDRVTPIPPRDWPGARAARTGETIRDFEMHLRRPDGTWRVVSSSAAPIRRGAAAATPRGVAVLLDVTEQRQSLEALQASELRFRTLVHQLPLGITEVGPDGANLFANPACLELVGRSLEDLRGSGWHACVHPDDREALLQDFGASVREGRPFDRRYRILRPDGSVRDTRGFTSPVREPGGAITGFIGVIQDLTAEQQAVEALRASEARFRDVAASAGEYVFEMDAGGVVTYISDAAERVLGYRPDELVGRSSLELMTPEEQARSGAFLGERVTRRERFTHFQQTAIHRSGRPVWLDISAVPILAGDGTLLGYRGTAMDVSERHEAEVERERLQAQLAQAQKMEVVGRLAGGVAHDFNNLLTVILGGGADLLQSLQSGSPPDAAAVEEILTAGRRAADLTRQLLAFARRQVVAPEPMDLNDALRQARKLLQRVIGEDVHLSQRLQEGLWPILCDPGLVHQVVMNLAVNARDAMPRGGGLTLSTANVELAPGDPLPDAGMAPGRHVRLSVQDTGVGIDAETRLHLFEPFFTTKPQGQGTGLGLATVYGIVRQSGGHIVVESEPGQGARFDVWFPALDAVTLREPEEAPTAPGGSETLLLVEDEAAVREVTARGLGLRGYRVLVADGAEGALRILRQGTPVDLVITDVVMPGTGGLELGSEIARLRPGVKILFVSGYTHEAVRRQGVRDEGLHFLPKPFTPAILAARVRALLDAR
jgi:two-component system, cell cycle sensor histidine kinase and response regulator CckA